MTRLDQNRAAALLAKKAGVPVSAVSRMTIWGNHSDTQYPDYKNARINGVAGDQGHHRTRAGSRRRSFRRSPSVARAVIKARGASSAASAANAIVDSLRSITSPTPSGDWFSAAVLSDGSYDIPAGLIYSFPLGVQRGVRLVDRPRRPDRRRREEAARRLGRRADQRARRDQRAAGAGGLSAGMLTDARFVPCHRIGRASAPIMPECAFESRPMIRLRGRLRSTLIGPDSVVSAEPWWPTESVASTFKWNRSETAGGTFQMNWPALSRPSAIVCHWAPG